MGDISTRIGQLYSQMAIPLIAIVSGAALLLGVWVAAGFILAGGDEAKIKQAKERLKYVIIGFIVLFAVAALVPMLIAALQEWADI